MSEMTFAQVGEILRLLREFENRHVELEWGELKVRVRPKGDETAVSGSGPQTDAVESAPQESSSADDARPQEPVRAEIVDLVRTEVGSDKGSGGSGDIPDHWVAVSAPMAGTFYRSAQPGEPAFVEVGDVVSAGETVALIEVMKLFTELKVETAGKVTRVEVLDGGLVEFDQALVWIEPA